MNEFYQPYYDFDQEPIQQGWIPDQNINMNQIYESPYDLKYENQVNEDIQNQHLESAMFKIILLRYESILK